MLVKHLFHDLFALSLSCFFEAFPRPDNQPSDIFDVFLGQRNGRFLKLEVVFASAMHVVVTQVPTADGVFLEPCDDLELAGASCRRWRATRRVMVVIILAIKHEIVVRLLVLCAFVVPEVGFEIRPHSPLFIGRARRETATVKSLERSLAQVVSRCAAHSRTGINEGLQSAWKNLDILLLGRVHAPTLEVDGVVDAGPQLNRLLEAEVVVALLQRVEVYVFERRLELAHLVRGWHIVGAAAWTAYMWQTLLHGV